MDKIFTGDTSKVLIQKEKAKFSDTNIEQSLRDCLGPWKSRVDEYCLPSVESLAHIASIGGMDAASAGVLLATSTGATKAKASSSREARAAAAASAASVRSQQSKGGAVPTDIATISSESILTAAAARAQLWRHREVAIFEKFERRFTNKASNAKEFPVIAALLKHERSLHLIKYAADILEWQATVFRVFRPGSITRAEAASMTNNDVINGVPEGEQRNQAKDALARFCKAFNATIVLPGYLRECAKNTFRYPTYPEKDEDDEPAEPVAGTLARSASATAASPVSTRSPSRSDSVKMVVSHSNVPVPDLSWHFESGSLMRPTEWDGVPQGMTEDSPLCFSLPSTLKDGNGVFVDPRSLCTTFILGKLRDMQATVVEALLPAAAAAGYSTFTKRETDEELAVDGAMDVDTRGGEAVEAVEAVEEGDAPAVAPFTRPREQIAFKAPLTTLLTPPAIVRRRLLAYDRARHLMPAVSAYAKQSLAFGEGNLAGFDFASVEQNLMDSLVPHLCPFEVTIREFQFKGEIGVTNSMSNLNKRIKQQPLTEATLDEIWREVDFEYRRALLTSQLEDCVTFLSNSSSGGGAALDGETKLEAYLLNTLLLDQQKWDEMKCTSLAQIKLCQLKVT